jgi:hypothetical protein
MALTTATSRTDYSKRIKDVVGRLKVTQSQNVYDADFEYGKQPLRWEEYTANGGAITHLAGAGGCAMYLPSSSNAITIRQTRPYHRYQPGKSMFLATAIQLGAANVNQFQRFGFFDDSNGAFFEQGVTTATNPFGMYVCVRSDTNYYPNEVAATGINTVKVDFANWSDPQNIKNQLDWTKIQMFWLEYAWYGAGAIRFGVFLGGEQYILHEITTANGWAGGGVPAGSGGVPAAKTGVTSWSRTGNLPVRYEQRDVGGTAVANTMYHYGVSVIVEGRRDEQRGFTYSYGMNPAVPRRYIPPNSTRFPVLSIQGRAMGTLEITHIGGGGAQQGYFLFGPNTASFTSNGNLPIVRSYQNSTLTFRSQHGIDPSVVVAGTLNTTVGSTQVTLYTASYLSMGAGVLIVSANLPANSIATGMPIYGVGYVILTMTNAATATATGVSATVYTSKVTLTGFTPSSLNSSFYYSVQSPSSLVLISPPVTSATKVGTATKGGANWGTNQYVNRYVSYLGVDGNIQVGRITANTSNSISYEDPILGNGAPLVAGIDQVGTMIWYAPANSYTVTVNAVGSWPIGAVVIASCFAPDTRIVAYDQPSAQLTVNQQTISTGSNIGVTITSPMYIGVPNRGQLLPQQLLISSDSLCVVELVASSPLSSIKLLNAGFQQLAQLGSENSFATRDVLATSFTGGEVVYAFTTPAGGSGILNIDLSSFFPLYNTINAGTPDILTVAVTTKSTQTPSPAIVACVGGGGTTTITFAQPHGLNVGDSITLSGFVPSAYNNTFVITATPTLVAATFTLSGTTSATTLGSATFSNGANVGAHLICQEAMS